MNQYIIEQLAFTRQLEIENDQTIVKKSFDSNHLKNIHAYLFQDSQKERSSGKFRQPMNDVHSKNRAIYPIKKPFFYHPTPSEEAIDGIISQADKNLAKTYNFNQKTEILSQLYADLDYQHPFIEGNSRTIRLFISDMALKHGIILNWQQAAKNKDEFYRARDFEIASRNLQLQPKSELESYMLEEAKRYNSKDYIAIQISQHQGRYLQKIIKDNCQAINKEHLLNAEQIKSVTLARQYAQHQFSENPEKLKEALKKIDDTIPDIVSGKAVLPTLPASDMSKSKKIRSKQVKI
ncbi:Fic family protein [Moraxella marmotae]|uniref:Fic family protein n=1 Tax=Moraxella marmotae TaxID=3344520 RepID=UPI0035F394EA